MPQLLQQPHLLPPTGILPQPPGEFGIPRQKPPVRSPGVMTDFDREDGAEGEERPVLISSAELLFAHSKVRHGQRGIVHLLEGSNFQIGVAFLFGVVKLALTDFEVVLMDVQSHEHIVDEEGVGSFDQTAGDGFVVRSGEAATPFHDDFASVEDVDSQDFVLVDFHLTVFQILIRHGRRTDANVVLLARPHLQTIENLSDIVSARFGHRLRGVGFDAHPLHPSDFHGPFGDDGFGGSSEFEIEAVLGEGSYLLGGSVVADADDGYFGVFDHLEEFGHSGSVAGSHSVDLVHDDASSFGWRGFVFVFVIGIGIGFGIGWVSGFEAEDLRSGDVPECFRECLFGSCVAGIEFQDVAVGFFGDQCGGCGFADTRRTGQQGRLPRSLRCR
mmetsp:Transcript_26352/g.52504  ORF Transcript_26352/g.52504 Transcript_26352/m.52504 type:complete len:386 (+) Transcript_26352:633-1790(+)